MKIEIKLITKMFTETTGIKNINFIIENSKIGVLGPNGAGKSTLIKIILGFLRPDKGEVTLNEISSKESKFNLNNVGYISTEDTLPSKLSVKCFLSIAKELNKNKENNLEEIAELFDFNLNQKTKIGKLSTGMRQKLKICVALGFKNDFYIFDEPTSGLDPLMRDNFIEFINKKLKDKTIIYCSHLVEEIEYICDKAIIIKNNQIYSEIDINEKTSLINFYKQIYGKEKAQHVQK